MARPSTTTRGVDNKVPALGYINVTLQTKKGVKKFTDFGIALQADNAVAVQIAEMFDKATPEAIQGFLAAACVFTYRKVEPTDDSASEDLFDPI